MKTVKQIETDLNKKYCGQKLVALLPQINGKAKGISASNMIDEIADMCKEIVGKENTTIFDIKPNRNYFLIDGQESTIGNANLYLSYHAYDDKCKDIEGKHKNFGNVLSLKVARDKNYIIKNISITTNFNSLNDLMQYYKSQC